VFALEHRVNAASHHPEIVVTTVHVKPDVAVSKGGLLIPKISLGDPDRELRRKVLAAPPLMLKKTPGTDVCTRRS
jgi:hypothetical protein